MLLILGGTVSCQHRQQYPVDLSACLKPIDDPMHLKPLLESAFVAAGPQIFVSIQRTLTWTGSDLASDHLSLDSSMIGAAATRQGLMEMRRALNESTSASSFADFVLEHFSIFQAIGNDGAGEVLFTAYFAPSYAASHKQGQQYQWPLYSEPSGSVDVTKLSRRELQHSGVLDGYEIAWLANELDAYLVHVNGSAELTMTDGSVMCVGHVRTNEFPYMSIGKRLIAEGYVSADKMSMQAIRRLHNKNPKAVSDMMVQNDRFVFFESIPSADFPRSALGIALTPEASFATDRSCFPPGGLGLISTTMPSSEGCLESFIRIMVDQDTGGAIQGPGRADIYLGIGAEAGARAGLQKSNGTLYYLLPKSVSQ
ncbi:MAG: MltA domain-containing protein [Phycisphaerales bacterium]|nr:MltA domain-containing protein [Phycisphaerales bacterium]